MAHVCDMLHLYVWRIAFVCLTRPINMCDMTHSYLWYDAFIPVTWRIRKCDMTHLYVWHRYVWHDSFLRVRWLIDMCDMTHWYVLIFATHCQVVRVHYDAFICVRHTVGQCECITAHSHVRHTVRQFECITIPSKWRIWICSKYFLQTSMSLSWTNRAYMMEPRFLQHTATHCITLHQTSTHREVLLYTAMHSDAQEHTAPHWAIAWRRSGLFCRIRNICAHDAHFTKEPNGRDKYRKKPLPYVVDSDQKS